MLYNEYEAMSEAGHALCHRIEAAVGPIIRKAVEDGATTVETEHLAIVAIGSICAELRIRRALRLRELEREEAAYRRESERLAQQRTRPVDPFDSYCDGDGGSTT